MPPRQLRLHTLRLSALPFFRSLLVKKGNNNTSRDDVAQGLVLAAGALARKPKTATVRSLGLA